MKEVNKHIEKVRNNPLMTILLLGGLTGGGTAAKFQLFDELVKPMHSIIYHQKISNHIATGSTLEAAEDFAEEEMIKLGYWKPRGAQ